MALTLFEKLWDLHLVAEPAPGVGLLHVDRHYVHDLHGAAFEELRRRGLALRERALTITIADHAVSSAPGRTGGATEATRKLVALLGEASRAAGVRHFGASDREQGIVHVVGPELGLTLPGMLVACGDSHTTTHGALGALALGIGATQILQVLGTQTVTLRKPRTMRIAVEGMLAEGVEAKDLILHIIGRLGVAAGTGHSVEFAGEAIASLEVEQRLTLCNLATELGAVHGIVAPDERTFAYLRGRPHAPQGASWDAALAHWRTLRSDEGARFDREERLDAREVRPQITWGTSPGQVLALDARVPDPSQAAASERARIQAALEYMGLAPGQPIAGTAVDHVFIGSCTNSRLSDLRGAAAWVRGRTVAAGVTAWVVPGSQKVKRDAEAEGLDRVFAAAGFEWREPGCSMCVGANGEVLAPGKRCVSTSNRNFIGRQGPGVRTHLAGPAVAALAAVLGRIPERVA